MKKALLILVFAVMACQPRWHETVPAAPDYDRGDSWYMSVGDLGPPGLRRPDGLPLHGSCG